MEDRETYCSMISSGSLSKVGTVSARAAMMTGFFSMDERGRSSGATAVIADGVRQVGCDHSSRKLSVGSVIMYKIAKGGVLGEWKRGLGVTGFTGV